MFKSNIYQINKLGFRSNKSNQITCQTICPPLHQTTDIRILTSEYWHQTSDIRLLNQKSDTRQVTPNNWPQISDKWYQTSDMRQVKSDKWQPPSDKWYQTTDIKQPTSNNPQLTTHHPNSRRSHRLGEYLCGRCRFLTDPWWRWTLQPEEWGIYRHLQYVYRHKIANRGV